MKHYDVPNIAISFLDGDIPERAKLVEEIGQEVRKPTRAMKLLIAKIADECMRQPHCAPTTTIQIGMMYGIVMGIMLEKDRIRRQMKAAI